MAITRTDTKTDIVLSFDGSATIAEAEAISKTLRESMDSKIPLVTFDLQDIGSVDISFFQLFLSLNNSLNSQNRHLMLRSLPPDHIVLETATLLGLNLKHYVTIVGEPR